MKLQLLICISCISLFAKAQSFSEIVPSPPFENVIFGSVAFSDVDNDGDEDVLITGRLETNAGVSKLYLNNGQGIFTEVSGTPFEDVDFSGIAFADVDGDNDQDVMISGASGSSFFPTCKLFLNNGSGVFTESTSSDFERVTNSAIAFADIDGDNDQDVLITGQNSSFNRISKLYKNDGAGNFTEVLDIPFDGIFIGTVNFADVDGDNDQDVLITGENGTLDPITKLYLNDGQGNYSELLNLPFEGVDGGSVDFADVDGDNDLDVLITGLGAFNSYNTILYLNEGTVSTEDTKDPTISFSLFPNPSGSNQLNVIYESERAGTLFIKIYNSAGQLITKQTKVINTNQHTFSVDISELNKGNYFVHFIDGEKSGVQPFIIE